MTINFFLKYLKKIFTIRENEFYKKNNPIGGIILRYSVNRSFLSVGFLTIFCTFFSFFFEKNLFAQSQMPPPSIRTQKMPSQAHAGDTLTKDSLTIVAESIEFLDFNKKTIYKIYPINYLEIKNNLIILKKVIDDTSIYWIRYRVLPINFEEKIFRLDSATVFRRNPFANGLPIDYDYTPPPVSAARDNLFETNALRYNGSFARGVSVGNAQNLVLNSQFNLNLTGKISSDLDLTAAISDQNIPLQAEGNTQQLREFDQISIQLRRKNDALLAGDFVQNALDNAYFLKYYKKMQGIRIERNDTSARFRQFSAGAAVARGKFRRQSVATQEGNQGPYRLVGESGENFIIILSGTERVWLDGAVLQRGDNADYVVDYNAATLTFTPKKLINANSRIVVEFEYADQNYLRTSFFATNQLNFKKLNIKFNFYGEQDSKNSSGVQQLDSLDKIALARGDAFVPAIQRDSFSLARVMYAQADTTVGGQTYSILRYTTRPDSAHFIATFSPVGEGQGNYLQDLNAVANGRVYRWVAPDVNGKKQGAFEPVRRLVAPVSQQILTTSIDYEPIKNLKINNELAGSRLDKNLFSNLNDEKNISFANKFQVSYLFFADKKRNWQVKTDVKNEFVKQQFQTISPFRTQEFSRDWNLQETQNLIQTNVNTIQNDENYVASSISLAKKDSFVAVYDFSQFRRSAFVGSRHAPRLRWQHRFFDFFVENNVLTSRDTGGGASRSNFERPKFDISKNFYLNNFLTPKTDSLAAQKIGFKIGFYGERERNSRRENRTDTLTNASFYYDFGKIYLESLDKGLLFSASRRTDFFPSFQSQKRNFSKASEIDEFGFLENIFKNSNSQFNVN
ncbi:MAG: hypothetical protein RL757_1912, partial [Bacteroidota bacterium]